MSSQVDENRNRKYLKPGPEVSLAVRHFNGIMTLIVQKAGTVQV